MTARDDFEQLFRDFIAGRINRRDLMAKGAIAGAGAALLTTGVATAAPRSVTRFGAAFQDAQPKPGGVLKVGMQSDPLQIVARSHDLTLHSRVLGYTPGLWERPVYQQRKFFDWGGWLVDTARPWWRL